MHYGITELRKAEYYVPSLFLRKSGAKGRGWVGPQQSFSLKLFHINQLNTFYSEILYNAKLFLNEVN